MKSNKYILGLVIVLLAIVYRLIPNLPNFSPITAAFLFSGAVISKKNGSLLAVLFLVLLSDFILNNTVLRVFFTESTGIIWFSKYMIFTFASYILIYFLGKYAINKLTIGRIAISSIIASLIFFLLTNMGAWIFDSMNLYPNNLSGLFMSLAAGIPFLQTSLISDLLFSGILFGIYSLVSVNILNRSKVNA